jgi:methionyl-tRNA formyltransferase
MMKLGLLVSGNLGYTVLKYLEINYPIIFVMTDKNSNNILKFCDDKKITCFVGNPRGGKCTTFIKNLEIDVLFSINYLFLIEKDLFSLPKKMAVNIHGSLLPKYRGRTPHVWAIINNETETGITAHLIDDGCDTGDIIEQIVVPINKEDTGADILEIFKEKYLQLVILVLEKIEQNKTIFKKQINKKASYFCKRTSEDGQIDWNWQKERIHNWVRAQAYPYPGAFTFYQNTKIVIDKISYTECGYTYDTPNGGIISVDPILVKTPNGVIKLDKIRGEVTNIEINQFFN